MPSSLPINCHVPSRSTSSPIASSLTLASGYHFVNVLTRQQISSFVKPASNCNGNPLSVFGILWMAREAVTSGSGTIKEAKFWIWGSGSIKKGVARTVRDTWMREYRLDLTDTLTVTMSTRKLRQVRETTYLATRIVPVVLRRWTRLGDELDEDFIRRTGMRKSC